MLFRNYVKRLKMDMPLRAAPVVPALSGLPMSCRLESWTHGHPDHHAAILLDCFEYSIDAKIFPRFRSLAGCYEVILDLLGNPGFFAAGNQLLMGPDGPIGLAQSVKEANGVGSIHNIAVRNRHRQRGFGKFLMLHAMRTLYDEGCRHIELQVCAANKPALRCYYSLGFQIRKTFYVETISPREEYII
jgi:mycothiol synthase